MKHLGLLLLILGVGLGAALGARVTSDLDMRERTKGIPQVLASNAKKAKGAYCAAAAKAKVVDPHCEAAEKKESETPPAKGTLSVTATAEDAAVYLADGDKRHKLGSAPFEGQIEVGKHVVLVEAPDHRPFYADVEVAEGKAATVAASLDKPGNGQVALTLEPATPGKAYLVDERGVARKMGPAPVSGFEYPAGSYTLRVTSDYFETYEAALNLTVGPPTRVVAKLQLPDRAKLVNEAKASVDKVRAAPAGLPADVAKLRTEWIGLLDSAIEPAAAAKRLGPPKMGPGDRLSEWFSLAGLPFVGALFLVIIGAMISRKAYRLEALAKGDGGTGQGGKVVDFGEMLGELRDEVAALEKRMRQVEGPGDEDFVKVRTEVEELQLGKVDLLAETRQRLQARFGMAGFAAIFGPFSAGERNLNRVWAALVDLHWPEATSSLGQAHNYFDDAASELEKLVAGEAS